MLPSLCIYFLNCLNSIEKLILLLFRNQWTLVPLTRCTQGMGKSLIPCWILFFICLSMEIVNTVQCLILCCHSNHSKQIYHVQQKYKNIIYLASLCLTYSWPGLVTYSSWRRRPWAQPGRSATASISGRTGGAKTTCPHPSSLSELLFFSCLALDHNQFNCHLLFF